MNYMSNIICIVSCPEGKVHGIWAVVEISVLLTCSQAAISPQFFGTSMLQKAAWEGA